MFLSEQTKSQEFVSSTPKRSICETNILSASNEYRVVRRMTVLVEVCSVRGRAARQTERCAGLDGDQCSPVLAQQPITRVAAAGARSPGPARSAR